MALSVIEKMGGLDILINCAGTYVHYKQEIIYFSIGLIFDGDLESTFP